MGWFIIHINNLSDNFFTFEAQVSVTPHRIALMDV